MSMINNQTASLFTTVLEKADSVQVKSSIRSELELQSKNRDWDSCSGIRIAAATPQIMPGDVESNTSSVCQLITEAKAKQIDVIVFPDLVLCGASCGDLFFQRALRDAVLKGLGKILQESKTAEMLICLSLPLPINGHLLKVSCYLFQGKIAGMHPADNLSNAEQRWFTPAGDVPGIFDYSYELLIEDPAFNKDVLSADKEMIWWQMLDKEGSSCPLVTRDLSAALSESAKPLVAENDDSISFTCDLSLLDFIPEHIHRYPFSLQKYSDAISGLAVFGEIPAADKPFAAGGKRYLSRPDQVLPLSVKPVEKSAFFELSPDQIPLRAISDARPEYPLYYRQLRSNLLEQSATDESIIVYAAAGENESTSMHVYAGRRLICANGKLLAESEAFESGLTMAELDPDNLFSQVKTAKASPADTAEDEPKSAREFPFLPPDHSDWAEFCYQALDLQARGLAGRLRLLGARPILGLSGGVDSTLALLVCLRASRILGRPANDALAVSMPGPGSSPRSVDIAAALARHCGCELKTIDIHKAVRLHLKEIGHDGSLDHTYENAQARERTQILMDLANMLNGIVIGTSDLSELALGFCTYNADQMSMYSVNHSIPKTLARIMLDIFAADLLTGSSKAGLLDNYFYLDKKDQRDLAILLREIISRPVSPELLPPLDDGSVSQKTESILGPYEHNDFFLFYLIYDGRHPREVFDLACETFSSTPKENLKTEMTRFIRRFIRNQFKRQAMPEGAQALPYSLSPHGSFQMPGDLSEQSLLDSLEYL